MDTQTHETKSIPCAVTGGRIYLNLQEDSRETKEAVVTQHNEPFKLYCE